MTPGKARPPGIEGALAGAVLAAASCAYAWGFTVDDALITARVAARIARGEGHRFNAGGPLVDAVTPLGFEYLLALPARGGALVAMYFAKWLGGLSLVASAAFVGRELWSEGWRARAVIACLAGCLPLAAWCVSGMETGLVVGLCTLALGGGRYSIAGAGLAAGLRPELVPFSLALCVGRAVARRGSARELIGAAAFAVAPALAVAALRLAVFGSPAPLAVWAKPSDLSHGAAYAMGALQWTGAPLLLCAGPSFARIDRDARAIAVAVAVHVAAIVLAGGDWMPFFRLMVPVLPGAFLVAGRLAAVAPAWATGARLSLAVLTSAVLVMDKGAAARGVLRHRLALVETAGPVLAGANRVAALDVGWVGVATGADVVDLAGVTDEGVAKLPGGHTSKRLPGSLLFRRGVDAAVLLASSPRGVPLAETQWARPVEAQAAAQALDLGFTLHAELELGGTSQHYAVLRMKNDP